MPVYSDAANPDLLSRIPPSARLIVDVGCGTGALGLAHKRRNPGARYFGIEVDPVVADVAASRLDRVACVDVETTPLPFGDEPVDCVIYGDVLEHLRNPWAVLGVHARHLAPSGTVLICMPNVEHWQFAERLLRGTFDYEEEGLFDRTHLRWFSVETMRRAIAEAGLFAQDVKPRIFDFARAQDFTRDLTPSLQSLGIDPAHYLQRSAPLQHVWRARRVPVQTIFIVSTMLPHVGGVSHVRIIEPMAALAAEGAVHVQIIEGTDVPPLPDDVPKIFIFHRPLLDGEEGLAAVRNLIAAGFIIVCEFDDHPGYIPVLQGKDIMNFRAVHAVQTSTEPLAQVLRGENPETVVFPNAISELPAPRNYADPSRLTLFFGGLNREEDWPPYIAALNSVAAIAGERLQFQIVNDQGFFEALRTPHKAFTPLCDYAVYQNLLAHSEFSFMPLEDTPFNRCKSDLKYIEAAAFRVTALASPTVYQETIQGDVTGVIFHDAQELQRKLIRLVADPSAGRAIADAARADIAQHRMLAAQTAPRLAWYRALWERRTDLNRALRARVPELAAQPAIAE